MNRKWLVVPAMGAVALVGVACGGDDDDDDVGDPNCTPVAAEDAVIDQDNLEFDPEELCVAEGQTVLFRNSESTPHTVTIDDENMSGDMREGDEFRWTPPGAGGFEITCDFHPQMRAVVTVRSGTGTE